MALYHELVPFTQLTRFGMPEFTVARRPILMQGQELPVGSIFPIAAVPNRTRIRQLYEQRAISVVAGTVKTSEQFPLRRLVEQARQAQQMNTAHTAHTPIAQDFDAAMDVALDLPAVDVAEENNVVIDARASSKPSRNRR
jgi:hypothetical protein